MANQTVFTYGFTSGHELKKLNGEEYAGYYYINRDGTIFSGGEPNPDSEVLLPITYVPLTRTGDAIISQYNEVNTGSFDGVYSVVTVKNYKNDIDIPVETDSLEITGPTITAQPDIFFTRNTDPSYAPGATILIDQNRTITVSRGIPVLLSFNFNSYDSLNNIKLEWFDSFDRVVFKGQDFVVDTAGIVEEETYYCTVTDSFGSDTTNEITIQVIGGDNPFLSKNLIKNGSGNDGTGDWESVGEFPEDVGKFLPLWQENVDAFTTRTGGIGTYIYHKFPAGWDGKQDKNQWYPRPDSFDIINGFNGDVLAEIKDNYIRAGQFSPVDVGGDNDYKLSKSSKQEIDVSEIGDLIDGKVAGYEGVKAIMFGWIGTRADQADNVSIEFEFLDVNGNILPSDNDSNNRTITGLKWFERIVNSIEPLDPVAGSEGYPRQPWYIDPNSKLLTGYVERDLSQLEVVDATGLNPGTNPDIFQGQSSELPILFDYCGLFYDGNVGAVYDRFGVNVPQSDGTVRNTAPEIKTCIYGSSTIPNLVPVGTRFIRVTKTYYHEAGIYDLVWGANEIKDKGIDYISDVMTVGLNLRLYPIVVTPEGEIIDPSNTPDGSPIIKGMDIAYQFAEPGNESRLAAEIAGGLNAEQLIAGQDLQMEAIIWYPPNGQEEKLFLFSTMLRSYDENMEGFQGGKTSFTKNLLGNYTIYCDQGLKDFITSTIGFKCKGEHYLYAFLNSTDLNWEGGGVEGNLAGYALRGLTTAQIPITKAEWTRSGPNYNTGLTGIDPLMFINDSDIIRVFK